MHGVHSPTDGSTEGGVWVRTIPERSMHLLVKEGHLQEDVCAEGWKVIQPEDRRRAVFRAKDQFVGVAPGGT